jgi:hypothetical protein
VVGLDRLSNDRLGTKRYFVTPANWLTLQQLALFAVFSVQHLTREETLKLLKVHPGLEQTLLRGGAHILKHSVAWGRRWWKPAHYRRIPAHLCIDRLLHKPQSRRRGGNLGLGSDAGGAGFFR